MSFGIWKRWIGDGNTASSFASILVMKFLRILIKNGKLALYSIVMHEKINNILMFFQGIGLPVSTKEDCGVFFEKSSG